MPLVLHLVRMLCWPDVVVAGVRRGQSCLSGTQLLLCPGDVAELVL